MKLNNLFKNSKIEAYHIFLLILVLNLLLKTNGKL